MSRKEGTDSGSTKVYLKREGRISAAGNGRYTLKDGASFIIEGANLNTLLARSNLPQGEQIEFYDFDLLMNHCKAYEINASGGYKALSDGRYTLKNGKVFTVKDSLVSIDQCPEDSSIPRLFEKMGK